VAVIDFWERAPGAIFEGAERPHISRRVLRGEMRPVHTASRPISAQDAGEASVTRRAICSLRVACLPVVRAGSASPDQPTTDTALKPAGWCRLMLRAVQNSRTWEIFRTFQPARRYLRFAPGPAESLPLLFVIATHDGRERRWRQHQDGTTLERDHPAPGPNLKVLVDALARRAEQLAEFLLGDG
jgi:hypothetical protein